MVKLVDDDRQYVASLLVDLVGVVAEFIGGVLAALMNDDFLKSFQVGDTILNAAFPLRGCIN